MKSQQIIRIQSFFYSLCPPNSNIKNRKKIFRTWTNIKWHETCKIRLNSVKLEPGSIFGWKFRIHWYKCIWTSAMTPLCSIISWIWFSNLLLLSWLHSTSRGIVIWEMTRNWILITVAISSRLANRDKDTIIFQGLNNKGQIKREFS